MYTYAWFHFGWHFQSSPRSCHIISLPSLPTHCPSHRRISDPHTSIKNHQIVQRGSVASLLGARTVRCLYARTVGEHVKKVRMCIIAEFRPMSQMVTSSSWSWEDPMKSSWWEQHVERDTEYIWNRRIRATILNFVWILLSALDSDHSKTGKKMRSSTGDAELSGIPDYIHQR
jgi:hypothetical protein